MNTVSESCGVCEVRMHEARIRETNLDGQRAIVTGANSGIGEGIARGLAEAGAAVVVNYVRGDEQAQRIVDDIRSTGGRAIAFRADVSSEEEVQAMFRRTIEEFGTVD
ncbi:MAG TPA: SDR family NAD(P)-dependent oxidoreductase, partial [Burkholderiales bacterium]|nr:SDR family NAD(P)-dependent oxidoreductase [Burkholderiales bacterium]